MICPPTKKRRRFAPDQMPQLPHASYDRIGPPPPIYLASPTQKFPQTIWHIYSSWQFSFPGLCSSYRSVGNVCFCASFLKQSERDGQALVWALVEFSLRRNNSEPIGTPRQAYQHLPWQEGAGEGEGDKSQHRDFCCSYYFLLWITISIGREWKILLHSYLLLRIGPECWYRALSVK